MNNDFENIINSIHSLSQQEKNRIFNLLQQEQMKNLSTQQKEIKDFLEKGGADLDRWNDGVDKFLKDSKDFFNEFEKEI